MIHETCVMYRATLQRYVTLLAYDKALRTRAVDALNGLNRQTCREEVDALLELLAAHIVRMRDDVWMEVSA